MNSSTGPVAELIINMKRNKTGIISRLINEGQQKEFRLDIDIPLAMITMVGTVKPACYHQAALLRAERNGIPSKHSGRAYMKTQPAFKSLFK